MSNNLTYTAPASSVIKDAYLVYGKYVNNHRHIPYLYDGLKPVYKRTILSALSFNGLAKTAAVAGHCFTGDTEVLTVNNEKVKMEYLSNIDLEGSPFYTFSISPDGITEVSRIKKCWKVKKTNKLVKVTLDNGEFFKCTHDHKIMLRDGTYEEASKLVEGFSLMPINIYTEEGTGYERRYLVHPGNSTSEFIYKLSANHPDSKYDEDITEGDTIRRHHIDFNSLNDCPDNIIHISNSKYLKTYESESLLKHNNQEKLLIPELHNNLVRVVKSVEFLDYEDEVYNLEVDSKYHNFPLSSGVYVKNCIGTMHPHSSKGPVDVIAQLVNCGVFRGQGNFGRKMLLGADALAAAERYTNIEINPGYRKLFSEILPYVPTFQNDFGNSEASYIPFPLPMSLIFGCMGIGLGTGVKLPAFTAKSLLKAYLADDPTLLESAYGYEILNKDDLAKLWYNGNGAVNWKMKVYDEYGATIIEGNPVDFKPDFTELENWRKYQRISIQDISDKTQRVKFMKLPRLQYPSQEEIHDIVEKVSSKKISYYIRTTFNECVYDIGIKDWIDITYNNYKGLLEKKRSDDIAKAIFDIEVFKNFRKIADLILNTKKTYEEIASEVGTQLEVVKTISKKTINTLRNLNPEDKVVALEDYIKDQKSLNFDVMIKDIIENI